ncbi:hypothetical protein JYT87_02265 [Nitrospira defluvii]|nr:hypothetical protein [Nitrospira defluvii]
MKTKKIIVLIRSDPRVSHRPCEAIRIALGLASSEHSVEVILSETAPLLLMEKADEWIDGERTVKFLSSLNEFIPAFFIDKDSSGEVDLTEIGFNTILLTREAIASKLARAESFLTF